MKQPTKPNKDIITIGDEYSGEDRPVYLCSWCNCTLSKLQDVGKNNTTYFCTRCAIEFDPESENLRKESKLIVPDRNAEAAAVTSIQTNMADEVAIRRSIPKRGGFAELEKKGIRIKNYHTTEKE
jgi:uncharacterized Zn ribbon protein